MTVVADRACAAVIRSSPTRRFLAHRRHCAAGYSVPQWALSPACCGGHLTEPYEQNTQQSPAFGRSTVAQPGHS